MTENVIKEEVEVDPINEPWNKYELEDGSRIRSRLIVTKILWPKGSMIKDQAKLEIGVSFQKIVVVFSPSQLKGTPNPNPPGADEVLRSDRKRTLCGITKKSEDWNVYRMADKRGIIKMMNLVSEIYRVDNLFDSTGSPYYLVNSTITITEPKEE